jgi:type I restriction enzyme S subunit
LQISENLLGLSLIFLGPHIETLGQGSTGQTELSRDTVGELRLLLPGEALRRAFDDLTIPLRDRADAALEETETLRALRDTLLPTLVSGELRIADAEKQIVAA